MRTFRVGVTIVCVGALLVPAVACKPRRAPSTETGASDDSDQQKTIAALNALNGDASVSAAVAPGRAAKMIGDGGSGVPQAGPVTPRVTPPPAAAPAGCTCRDGSPGCCGRGCCSHHGGIAGR